MRSATVSDAWWGGRRGRVVAVALGCSSPGDPHLVPSLAELLAPATAPVPPSPRDSPQWSPRTAPRGPGGAARTSLPPSPPTPVAPHGASDHQDVTTEGSPPHGPSARGDSPWLPADATEDFSGDTPPKEDGDPIPARPPLPPAPLVADFPETSPQPGGDGSGALGEGSLERQRKAVTFLHLPMGLPGTTVAASPHPHPHQGGPSPTAPQGTPEMGAEPGHEHPAGYGDAGTGTAEPRDEAAVTPVAGDIPSPSPTATEVTPRGVSEWPTEGTGEAEDGSTGAPRPLSPTAPELEGAEHLLHPPAPRQPPSPSEEDTSGEAKREDPPTLETHPPAPTDTPWPSSPTPHPWVPEVPGSPSAEPLFEPSTTGGPGGAPLLDADSGSGEEPLLEERELLAWTGTGNTSRHGEHGATGCWGRWARCGALPWGRVEGRGFIQARGILRGLRCSLCARDRFSWGFSKRAKLLTRARKASS